MSHNDADGPLLDCLTEGQRAALDHLIQFKTSKQIARDLGISPHTVEQRLRYARAKLGVHSRSDLAAKYRDIKEVCEKVACEDFDLSYKPEPTYSPSSSDAEPQLFANRPDRSDQDLGGDDAEEYRLVPEMFEGPYGTGIRVAAIAAVAVLLAVLMLAGLAIFGQLSDIVAG